MDKVYGVVGYTSLLNPPNIQLTEIALLDKYPADRWQRIPSNPDDPNSIVHMVRRIGGELDREDFKAGITDTEINLYNEATDLIQKQIADSVQSDDPAAQEAPHSSATVLIGNGVDAPTHVYIPSVDITKAGSHEELAKKAQVILTAAGGDVTKADFSPLSDAKKKLSPWLIGGGLLAAYFLFFRRKRAA